jgi:hypothetical protein
MKDDEGSGQEGRRGRQARLRRTGPLAVALLGVAIVAAACSNGPSSPGATGSSTPSSAASNGLALAQCMRSHGITNFPDPRSGGGIAINAGSGVDPNSPQYQAAWKACQSKAGGGGSQAQRQQAYAAGLKYARCMQTHGVPNFPDPKAPGSVPVSQSNSAGGSGYQGFGSGGVNPDSPQFIAANKACEHYLPAGQGPATNTSGGGS